MSWARPSELYRALECPASTVLEKAEDKPGKAAEWGKELHAWKETLEATPRVAKWLTEITDDPVALRNEQWPQGTHEQLLKLDAEGQAHTKLAGTQEERDEFFDGGFIRGIADWVGGDVIPHIDDLKTGRFPPDTTPGAHPQLLFYAYVWLSLHPSEPGVLLSFTHWPRYPKGLGPTRIGPDYVSSKEVQDWYWTKLIPAHRLAQRPSAKEDARPGPWCMYCRSADFCPLNETTKESDEGTHE